MVRPGGPTRGAGTWCRRAGVSAAAATVARSAEVRAPAGPSAARSRRGGRIRYRQAARDRRATAPAPRARRTGKPSRCRSARRASGRSRPARSRSSRTGRALETAVHQGDRGHWATRRDAAVSSGPRQELGHERPGALGPGPQLLVGLVRGDPERLLRGSQGGRHAVTPHAPAPYPDRPQKSEGGEDHRETGEDRAEVRAVHPRRAGPPDCPGAGLPPRGGRRKPPVAAGPQRAADGSQRYCSSGRPICPYCGLRAADPWATRCSR
jgi:hypothetical protein